MESTESWTEEPENSLYPALIGIVALVLAMTALFNAGHLAEVAAAGGESHNVMVPEGTGIVVRLDRAVSSADSGSGFAATLTEPVTVAGMVVIPSGARAQGVVVNRNGGSARWVLSSIETGGRTYAVEARGKLKAEAATRGRTDRLGWLAPADTQMKFSLQQAAQVAAW
jgi:hypothetical protein